MPLIEASARFERRAKPDQLLALVAEAALADLIRATADDLNSVACMVAQHRHGPAELARRLDAIATAVAVLAADAAEI
jgi:hypothetical protein